MSYSLNLSHDRFQKSKTLPQCFSKVGRTSATLAQHQTALGRRSCCWIPKIGARAVTELFFDQIFPHSSAPGQRVGNKQLDGDTSGVYYLVQHNKQDVKPMLDQCWASVEDGGPS